MILGAGVIGLSTALCCARRGMKVTIVERKARRRDGCSFGNAGMIVPSHFIPLAAPGMVRLGLKWMWNPESPFYIKPRLDFDLVSWGLKFWQAATKERVAAAAPVLRDLSLLSRRCFEEIGLDFGLVKKGLIMLCKKQQTLDEAAHMAGQARALGIPAEVLDARATAALDPAVTMDICGSVFFPKDCHLSPGRFISAMETELVRLGAEFIWETETRGFETEGGRLRAAKTTRGDIESDEFVLCGGVTARNLLSRPPYRKRSERGRASGSEGVWHLSLRCSRRVNHDHTIDFEGHNYEIAPTLRKTVTLVYHPRRRFWILEHPPKDIWPPILGHFTL